MQPAVPCDCCVVQRGERECSLILHIKKFDALYHDTQKKMTRTLYFLPSIDVDLFLCRTSSRQSTVKLERVVDQPDIISIDHKTLKLGGRGKSGEDTIATQLKFRS